MVACRSGLSSRRSVAPDADDVIGRDRVDGLIVFVGPRLSSAKRQELAGLAEMARRWSIGFVGIVGSFRVHLDDPDAEEAERFALSRFRKVTPESRVVVFRPGHLLGPHSALSRALRRLAPLSPLIPRRLATCVLECIGAVRHDRIGAARRGRTARRGQHRSDPGPRSTGLHAARREHSLE